MKRFAIAVVVGVLVLVAAIAVASRLTLSALPEPGQTETFLATKAKHYLVQRSTGHGVPPPPSDRQAGTKEGEKLFGTECAACHGLSGQSPTDAGRWMYPRAANLASRDSQSYSDQEVFWIIKNGIRLSGMPAFGRVEPDEHIWDLAFYVRTLPKVSAAERPIRALPARQYAIAGRQPDKSIFAEGPRTERKRLLPHQQVPALLVSRDRYPGRALLRQAP
jgi:mono/diheme cytochrome c family protein